MTAALELALGHSLAEVSRVQRVTRVIAAVGSFARFVGPVALLSASVARWWRPDRLSTTDEVWEAVEKIAPSVERILAVASSGRAARSAGRKQAEGSSELSVPSFVDDELLARLDYAQLVLDDALGARRVQGYIRRGRKIVRDVLEDPSVPPELRLVVCHARGIPVLLVLAQATELLAAATQASDPARAQRSRRIHVAALRQGLDSVIAYAHGVCARDGLPCAEPPSMLTNIPEPMDIRAINERWKNVQHAV